MRLLHGNVVSAVERAVFFLCLGGLVVYSTCSLRPTQNENVVVSVLERCGEGIALAPLPFPLSSSTDHDAAFKDVNCVPAVPVDMGCYINQSGHPCACRFESSVSNMSGLFMCCLRKKDESAFASVGSELRK